jgi:hypothetical protein
MPDVDPNIIFIDLAWSPEPRSWNIEGKTDTKKRRGLILHYVPLLAMLTWAFLRISP